MADTGHRHKPLSVLMLDVDHFKLVNDTHGHAVGDLVLQHITEIMRSNVRNVDTVARLGGEEFVIVMPDTHETFAVRIADRLRQRIADTPTVLPDGRALTVTVSIGCAMREMLDDETMEALMKRADMALYRAKGAGRNRVERDVPATNDPAAYGDATGS
ncbi:MAG: GGDEF domain-containing protein [Thalassobaculum sp.]